MPMSKEQILSEIHQLDPVDQEEIADSIMGRFDLMDPLTPEQLAIVRRRREDVEQGHVVGRPAEEVIERLRAKAMSRSKASA